jgi:hypothetical protein
MDRKPPSWAFVSFVVNAVYFAREAAVSSARRV